MTLVATEFVPFIVMPENFSILLMLSLRGTIRRFCSLTPYDVEPGMIIFHNGMYRVFALLCIVQVDTLKLSGQIHPQTRNLKRPIRSNYWIYSLIKQLKSISPSVRLVNSIVRCCFP